jgi:hypothetical protein
VTTLGPRFGELLRQQPSTSIIVTAGFKDGRFYKRGSPQNVIAVFQNVKE